MTNQEKKKIYIFLNDGIYGTELYSNVKYLDYRLKAAKLPLKTYEIIKLENMFSNLNDSYCIDHIYLNPLLLYINQCKNLKYFPSDSSSVPS